MERKNVKKSFIGLDLSLTSTGFSIKDEDGNFNIETIKTKPKDFDNDLCRLQYIRDIIIDKIPLGTQIICIEDFYVPFNKAHINSSISLIKLGIIIRLSIYEKGIPFIIPASTQIKKYVSGRGDGPKGIAIREVYRQWELEAKDDNQADSAVMAHMAQYVHYRLNNEEHFENDLYKYQKDMIDKILKERSKYNF